MACAFCPATAPALRDHAAHLRPRTSAPWLPAERDAHAVGPSVRSGGRSGGLSGDTSRPSLEPRLQIRSQDRTGEAARLCGPGCVADVQQPLGGVPGPASGPDGLELPTAFTAESAGQTQPHTQSPVWPAGPRGREEEAGTLLRGFKDIERKTQLGARPQSARGCRIVVWQALLSVAASPGRLQPWTLRALSVSPDAAVVRGSGGIQGHLGCWVTWGSQSQGRGS